MTEQTARPKFDGYAADYDGWFMRNENMFLSELRLVKAALDEAAGHDISDGANMGRVLSVGCGSGLFEKSLNDIYGVTITEGVEPSEDMASIARKRGMTVQIATAASAVLEPESYDIIYLNGCSSYMDDLVSNYKTCVDALKPGGRIVLIDVPRESAYGTLYLLARAKRGYDYPEFAGVAPKEPYPLPLVDAAFWYTTPEKRDALATLGLHDFRFRQTLTMDPVYSDDFIEDPTEGYQRGSYVAVIATK